MLWCKSATGLKGPRGFVRFVNWISTIFSEMNKTNLSLASLCVFWAYSIVLGLFCPRSLSRLTAQSLHHPAPWAGMSSLFGSDSETLSPSTHMSNQVIFPHLEYMPSQWQPFNQLITTNKLTNHDKSLFLYGRINYVHTSGKIF